MKLVGQETSIYVIIGCRSPAAEEIELSIAGSPEADGHFKQ